MVCTYSWIKMAVNYFNFGSKYNAIVHGFQIKSYTRLVHDKFIVDSIIWGYSLPWKSETLKKVFFWVSFQEYCLWLKNILHISEWWNYAYRLVRLEKSYIHGLLCFSLKSKFIVYGFTRKFHKFRLTRVLVKW